MSGPLPQLKLPAALQVMNPRQRMIVLAVGVVVFGGLILWAGVFSRGPKMAPLYPRLETADAAEITKALEDEGIKYSLADNGTTVMVPAKDVYSTRLRLANLGLPRGGVVGFEVMDQSRIGATDFERRMSYIRALQGELTRTITQMPEVEQARVHIVLPEPSLFVNQSKPATAAVLLKLKPYGKLGKDQVQGVIHLVAHSVEGLRPEDVTVVDVHGRILSNGMDPLGGGTSPSSSGLLEIQNGFQRELETSLQGLLEQVLGPGNVVTRVSAELNFDEKTVDRKLFEPVVNGTGLVRSLEELEETFQGTGNSPGGVPGVTSNIPGYPQATESQSTYEKTNTIKNFEVNEIKEHIVVAPGSVKRLSVAVVVNRDLSAGEQKAIEATVAAAIGMDPARRDQITITGLAFNTDLAAEVKADMERQRQSQQKAFWQISIAAGAGAVFLLVLAQAALRRSRRARPATAAVAVEDASRQVAVTVELTPEERDRERIRDQVQKLAQQKPEDVAQLLRTWMNEE